MAHGTVEERPSINTQPRDKHSIVNGTILGEEGSDSRKPKFKVWDEFRASLRVKGNKVKELTGIVLEISDNGYVRLSSCGWWSKVVRNFGSPEKYEGFKKRIPGLLPEC